MRVCSGAGCLARVADSVRYCDECTVGAIGIDDDGIRTHSANTADRDKYRKLYGCARWRILARIVIHGKPICQRCDEALSEVADHRIPAGVAIAQCLASGLYPMDPYAGFFIRANLWALCRKCHAIKTIEDKAHVGSWPSVIDVQNNAPKHKYSF